MRAATGTDDERSPHAARFYPRDPCGPRRLRYVQGRMPFEFLSARPMRAATSGASILIPPSSSFYPRDPCGPRLVWVKFDGRRNIVSIRATHAGRDLWPTVPVTKRALFLSARPMRAATTSLHSCLPCWPGFYPRDPCGPRLSARPSSASLRRISIRATHAGRDRVARCSSARR